MFGMGHKSHGTIGIGWQVGLSRNLECMCIVCCFKVLPVRSFYDFWNQARVSECSHRRSLPWWTHNRTVPTIQVITSFSVSTLLMISRVIANHNKAAGFERRLEVSSLYSGP